jgi:predicted PhzF superfamily epimerase YddE/YHI9
MRTLPFSQVDVFTDRPFAGNPLAVCPDAEGLTAAGPPAADMARAVVLPPDEERVVLQGRQIGRPSFLTVAVSGTPGRMEDVRVGGSVQPVLRGELSLAD